MLINPKQMGLIFLLFNLSSRLQSAKHPITYTDLYGLYIISRNIQTLLCAINFLCMKQATRGNLHHYHYRMNLIFLPPKSTSEQSYSRSDGSEQLQGCSTVSKIDKPTKEQQTVHVSKIPINNINTRKEKI